MSWVVFSTAFKLLLYIFEDHRVRCIISSTSYSSISTRVFLSRLPHENNTQQLFVPLLQILLVALLLLIFDDAM